MKLSEARIRKLAKAMGRTLVARGAVKLSGSAEDVSLAISRVLILDQKVEAEIDEEARGMVARQRNPPPSGTGEYQAAFVQARRSIAARRRFVL